MQIAICILILLHTLSIENMVHLPINLYIMRNNRATEFSGRLIHYRRLNFSRKLGRIIRLTHRPGARGQECETIHWHDFAGRQQNKLFVLIMPPLIAKYSDLYCRRVRADSEWRWQWLARSLQNESSQKIMRCIHCSHIARDMNRQMPRNFNFFFFCNTLPESHITYPNFI